ncbi:MAG: FtsX-like permease family protein [Burkholderiaceae bacterium]|nr:FtsX-like permease family protein [Burkholderiaceae bacterium]
MTLRDWRAGELRFLLLTLVVAVAALSSVGFFVDRMRTGLSRDAHQMLGGDLVIHADQPLGASWRDEAQKRGLSQADTVGFPSMALAGEGERATSKLVALKAVAAGYPLRGSMKLADAANAPASPADGIPAAGTAWVDATLLAALNLKPGGTIRLGESEFQVAKIIAIEPDRGASFMSFAPRVMINLADLAATGLVQPSSRVQYRLLLAGEAKAVAGFRLWAQALLDNGARGVRIESLETGRPEMHSTLERGERFLALVGLLSAMLAAVAIGMAARRFMLRHLDACAMLRCLGMTQNRAMALYLIEFLLIGLAGSGIGALLGFGAHFVLMDGLGKLVFAEMPPPTIMPAFQAIAAGLLLLVGFALPPVLQLRNVPHNRVIRREREAPQPLALVTYGGGLVAFVLLLLWQAGDSRIGLLAAAGFAGGMAAFVLAGWLALKAVQVLRRAINRPNWNFALTSLQRRPGATIVQIVALAVGLMALLLLTVVRADLMQAWRQTTPADAPNRYVLNIQPEQKEAVEQQLQRAGLANLQLYPMIRGRLIEVNGQPVRGEHYVEDRAKRLVEREFNLSTMREQQPYNEIIAGRWYDDTQPEASVEDGLAKLLGLRLGDQLAFDIAGQKIEAKITSLRRLEWGSMRVNFFVIINPQAVRGMPQSWITAIQLPDSKAAVEHELTRDFPNLTVIDTGSIIRQLQDVLEQVIAAVEFLFLFTLASGLLVLYAALLGSHDERIRESGLLRALGATRTQLRQAQWVELSLIGGLSGLLAATGAAITGWVLAHFAFSFPWTFSPLVWLAGLAGGAICAVIGGWFGLRNVLNQPPLLTLRES